MKWICLICEKEVLDLTADIQKASETVDASWPNLEGGTISIDFGYGSKFDTFNDAPPVEYQTCICDSCFEKKKHLTRKVRYLKTVTWKVLEDQR